MDFGRNFFTLPQADHGGKDEIFAPFEQANNGGNNDILELLSNRLSTFTKEKEKKDDFFSAFTGNINNNVENPNRKHELDEYSIPPKIELCKEYERATSTGFVIDYNFFNRDKTSLMFLDNKPFEMGEDIDNFSQMGVGYSLFFKYLKFLLFITVIPILLYALYTAHYYSKGTGCIPPEKLTSYQTDIDVYLETSSAPRAIGSLAINTASRGKTLSYFMKIFCYTKILWKDNDCEEYSLNNCFSLQDEKCEKMALDKFKDEYSSRVCIQDLTNVYSLANRSRREEEPTYYDRYEIIIDILMVIILYLLLAGFTYLMKRLTISYDNQQLTVNDYSVKLCNIPMKDEFKHGKGYNLNLIEKLKSTLEKAGYTPREINLVYDVEDYLGLKQSYHNVKTKARKDAWIRHQTIGKSGGGQLLGFDFAHVLDPSEAIETIITNQIETMEKDFTEGNAKGFLGTAFVSFETSQETKDFYEDFRFRGPLYHMCGIQAEQRRSFSFSVDNFNYSSLYAEEAPEPRDIIWENQRYSRFEQTWRAVIISCLALLAVFAGLIAIGYFKLLAVPLL